MTEISHHKRFINQLAARKKPFSSEDEKNSFVAKFVGEDANLEKIIKKLIKNNFHRSSNPMWCKSDNAMIERVVTARKNFQVKEATEKTASKKKAPAAQPKKTTGRQPEIQASTVEGNEEEGNDEQENADEGKEETAPPQRKRRANDNAAPEQEEKTAPAPKKKATKTKKGKNAAAPAEKENNGEAPQQQAEENVDPAPIVAVEAQAAAPPVPEHFDEVAEEPNADVVEQIVRAEAPGQVAEILAVLQDFRTQVREEQQTFKEEVFAKIAEFKREMIAALDNLMPDNGPTVGDTLQENMLPIKTEPHSANRPPAVPRHRQ